MGICACDQAQPFRQKMSVKEAFLFSPIYIVRSSISLLLESELLQKSLWVSVILDPSQGLIYTTSLSRPDIKSSELPEKRHSSWLSQELEIAGKLSILPRLNIHRYGISFNFIVYFWIDLGLRFVVIE